MTKVHVIPGAHAEGRRPEVGASLESILRSAAAYGVPGPALRAVPE